MDTWLLKDRFPKSLIKDRLYLFYFVFIYLNGLFTLKTHLRCCDNHGLILDLKIIKVSFFQMLIVGPPDNNGLINLIGLHLSLQAQ